MRCLDFKPPPSEPLPAPFSASRGFHGCQSRALGERLESVGNWRGELSEGQVLALATWRHLPPCLRIRGIQVPGHQRDHLSACKHPLMHKSIPPLSLLQSTFVSSDRSSLYNSIYNIYIFTRPVSLLKYQCNTGPCITTQYYAITCNTTQYHRSVPAVVRRR